VLIIDAELTAPPSEVILFRDITMYTNVFLDQKILVECHKEERDFYYKWLRNKCALDFVEDFVKTNTVKGLFLRKKRGNINVDRINYYNFNEIIYKIERILI
jgi:hypothetical protein